MNEYKIRPQVQLKAIKLLFSLRQEQDSTGRIIKSGERILEKNMENDNLIYKYAAFVCFVVVAAAIVLFIRI